MGVTAKVNSTNAILREFIKATRNHLEVLACAIEDLQNRIGKIERLETVQDNEVIVKQFVN